MKRVNDTHGDSTDSPTIDGATRRAVLKATGVGVGGLALGGLSGTASAAAPPRLHTEGKWIRDANGNDVKLRGLATAGLGFISYDWYPKSVTEILDWATDSSRGWHPNVVRLPCDWGGIQDYGGVQPFVTDVLRPAVDQLADRGVYAMIDFHLVRPYTQAATDDYNADNDGTLAPIDDVMTDFWGTVAPEFATDSHVIYELFNEPTYPVTWSSYGESVSTQEDEWLLWRDTAQPWVDQIQADAPNTPLIIGSPHWTSRTSFAPQYPFDGDNLIYAGHIYPDNGQPSEFDGQYGQPANDVPVVITEFGWDPNGEGEYLGTTSGWGQPFRDWVEGYENMGWCGFSFDDSWSPTFFSSPESGANEPWSLKDGTDEEGGFVKSWLAETVGDGGDGGDGGDDGDSTAPTAPSNLSATDTTTSSVDLSWSASSDSGGSGLDHYNVSVDGSVDQQVPAGTTAATVSGLSSGTSYDFSVTAVDGAGNESSASNTVTAATESDGGSGGGGSGDAALESITLTDTTKWNTCNYSLDYQLSTGSGVDHVEVSFANQTNTWASGTKSSSSTPTGTVSFSAGGTEDDTYEITVEALDASGSVLASQTITDVADGSNTSWSA